MTKEGLSTVEEVFNKQIKRDTKKDNQKSKLTIKLNV